MVALEAAALELVGPVDFFHYFGQLPPPQSPATLWSLGHAAWWQETYDEDEDSLHRAGARAVAASLEAEERDQVRALEEALPLELAETTMLGWIADVFVD